jgi:hypothetical protein
MDMFVTPVEKPILGHKWRKHQKMPCKRCGNMRVEWSVPTDGQHFEHLCPDCYDKHKAERDE